MTEEPPPNDQGSLPPPRTGPPGSGVFSLEDRRAPGLYLVAWVLALLGLGLLLAGLLSSGPANAGAAALLIGGSVLLGLAFLAFSGYQSLARADRRPDAYRGPAPLLVFGALFFVQVPLAAVLLVAGMPDPTTDPYGTLASLVLTTALYALLVWTAVVRTGALTWADMGWPTAGMAPARLVGDIVTAALAIVPTYLVASLVGAVLAQAMGVTPTEVLPPPRGWGDVVALALTAIVVAPIGEELFFRGFALTAWRRDLGAWVALIRTTIFFALIHILNVTAASASEGFRLALIAFATILPVAYVLGWLFLRRGIVASIAGHMVFNAIGLALLIASTGVR